MSLYEDLVIKNNHIPIGDNFKSTSNFKGLYDMGVIVIDKQLSETRKAEILYEELAHHKLTWGDITDQSQFNNRKFENYAKRAGYQAALPLRLIIEAYCYGVSNLYELSNYVQLSENYILEAIDVYKKKYGLDVYYKGYVIKFEPLQVFKHQELDLP